MLNLPISVLLFIVAVVYRKPFKINFDFFAKLLFSRLLITSFYCTPPKITLFWLSVNLKTYTMNLLCIFNLNPVK